MLPYIFQPTRRVLPHQFSQKKLLCRSSISHLITGPAHRNLRSFYIHIPIILEVSLIGEEDIFQERRILIDCLQQQLTKGKTALEVHFPETECSRSGIYADGQSYDLIQKSYVPHAVVWVLQGMIYNLLNHGFVLYKAFSFWM